jgi:hypothetical protein
MTKIQRLILAVLATTIAALACTSAPALAAAPETPTLTVQAPVHATTKQYEVATEIAGLDRQEAEASKRSAKAEKAKSKPASCRKDFIEKKNKYVPKKSKKNGKVKK